MTTPLVIINRYPDYTGVNSDYLMVNELHDLNEKKSKIFVLNNGPFYSQSLEVTDTSTGTKLKPNDDYKVGLLNPLATSASDGNLTVFSTIELTDKWVTLPELSVTYQFVGGPYSANTEALEQAVKDLNSKPTEVYWDQIQGKPVAYPPEYHLHDAKDIYGLDETVAALYTISASIDQLAEDLANAAVPEDTVVFGGETKYTIDNGLNLSNQTSPLILSFPRSTTENAIVKLHCEYLSNGSHYYFDLLLKENVVEGFEEVFLDSNAIVPFAISNVHVKTHDGINYLKLECDNTINTSGFGSGFIIVKDVTVTCDNTEEYNETYSWLATYPSSGKEVAVSKIDRQELNKKIKIHVDSGLAISDSATVKYLRFPRPNNNTEFLFTVNLLRGNGLSTLTLSSVEHTSNGYTEPKVQTALNDPIENIELKFDANFGYLKLEDTNNDSSWYSLISEVIIISNSEVDWNAGWLWSEDSTDFNAATANTDALTISDIRSYEHTHVIDDISTLNDVLMSKVNIVSLGVGLGTTEYTDMDSLKETQHLYMEVTPTDIATLETSNYPTNLFTDLDKYTGSLFNIIKFNQKVKQEIIFTDGSSCNRWLNLDTDNETVLSTSIWTYGTNSLDGLYNTESRGYHLDLSSYTATKYYLVECTLGGSDLSKLNNNLTGINELTLTYGLGGNGAVTVPYGSLFGKLSYGANSNLKPYYSLTALCDDVDKTKYPFHSIWVSPLDSRTEFKCFIWVKGGGTLSGTLNGESLVLHPKTGNVLVGVKSDTSEILISNEVDDPAATAITGWEELINITVDSEIKSTL